MKTIGAKELRLHLDKVLDHVLSGEDIIVKHRFIEPVRVSACTSPTHKSEPLSGLKAFDEAQTQPSAYDNNKSIKELYSESIAKKYTK